MLLFGPKFFISTLQFLHKTPPPPQILAKTLSGYPRNFPGIACSCSSNSGCVVANDDFEPELGLLLAFLPEEMRGRVQKHPGLHDLIEVVMNLGRKPLACFPSGDFEHSDCPISFQDIEYATSQGNSSHAG